VGRDNLNIPEVLDYLRGALAEPGMEDMQTTCGTWSKTFLDEFGDMGVAMMMIILVNRTEQLTVLNKISPTSRL
jgi:hypothetical protein